MNILDKVDGNFIDLEMQGYNGAKFSLNQNMKLVFKAFHGGYFGPSYYYYVRRNINTNEYEFKYGYSKEGARIQENEVGEHVKIVLKSEEVYRKFINELFEVVKNWETDYFNSDILDGIQWDIDIIDNNVKYCGSNDFPSDYSVAMKVINKYFDVDII